VRAEPVVLTEHASVITLQAAWHPGSSSHFAVLANDNRWRLYHTGKLTEAEQTFWLRLPGAQVCVVKGGSAVACFISQLVRLEACTGGACQT
jgi:hypothetical protein